MAVAQVYHDEQSPLSDKQSTISPEEEYDLVLGDIEKCKRRISYWTRRLKNQIQRTTELEREMSE